MTMTFAKRRKLVAEDLDRGYGGTSIPTDSGGSRAANKVGLHTFSNIVNVADFNAVGDGATDDTSAFTSAIAALVAIGGGRVYVPDGEYKITSQLSFGSIAMVGSGQESTKILKRFNGDCVVLGDRAQIEKIWVDGGHTQGFTGRGITITAATFSQKIFQCRIDNCNGYCVEFVGAASGTYSTIMSCLIGVRDIPYVAIKLPNDGGPGGAVQRSIIDCRTGGAVLVDVSGANTTFIDDCYCHGIEWNGGAATSTNTFISNTRLSVLSTWVVSGTQTHISNCIIGDAVTFDTNSLRCYFSNTQISGSFIVTDLGTDNVIYDKGFTYTPTWSSAGTAPAIVNGTIQAQYARDGRDVTIRIRQVMGSSTTFGNALNGWTWTLPNTFGVIGTDLSQQIGTAFITDASTGITTTHKVQAAASSLSLSIFDMAGGLVKSNSLAWAVSDSIEIFIRYSLD